VMLLLLTLRGTPTVYNGDEFGMMDGYVPPTRSQDPTCLVDYHSGRCRDNERTPLQWTADEGPNAGFTGKDKTPWLPVSSEYVAINLADQKKDPNSFLALMKKVLGLRSAEHSLHAGEYSAFACGSEQVLCFIRRAEGYKAFLITLNLGSAPTTVNGLVPGGLALTSGTVVIDSVRPGITEPTPVDLGAIHLSAEQSLVIDLGLAQSDIVLVL